MPRKKTLPIRIPPEWAADRLTERVTLDGKHYLKVRKKSQLYAIDGGTPRSYFSHAVERLAGYEDAAERAAKSGKEGGGGL